MLVWEKEYNRNKKRLKFLFFVLILLLLTQLIYNIFFSKNYLIFSDRYRGDFKDFDLRNPNEIIVSFDYGFLDSKKYNLLVDRAYSLSEYASVGRDNPFSPLGK